MIFEACPVALVMVVRVELLLQFRGYVLCDTVKLVSVFSCSAFRTLLWKQAP
jgi:hypothetical protein